MLRGRRNTLLNKVKEDPVNDIYHVGLVNLGNSCFYNTILQALAVSQPLSHIIANPPESSPALQRLSPASSNYDPDTSTLPSPLPITQALLNLLKSLDLSSDPARGRKIFNPKALLRHLSLKHEEYAQATQQDAHEILRHLIDGVMMEEVDLIKKVQPKQVKRKRPPNQARRLTLRGPSSAPPLSAMTPVAEEGPDGINVSNGLSADVVEEEEEEEEGTQTDEDDDVSSTSSSSESSSDSSGEDEDDTRQHSKGDKLELTPFIAQIFDGKLASVVICDECKHVSRTTEDFMDISLSLRDDAGNKMKKRDRIRRTLQGGFFGKRSSSPESGKSANGSKASSQTSRPSMLSLSETEASSSASEFESDEDHERNLSRSRHNSLDPSRFGSGHKPSWMNPKSGSQVRDQSPLGRAMSVLSQTTAGSGSSSVRRKKGKIPKPTPEQVAYIRRLLVEIPGPSAQPLPIRVARPPGSAAASTTSSTSSLSSLNHSMATLKVSPEQMSTDLYECLRQFTSVEVLEGDNSFACHNCWKLLNPDLVEQRKREKEQKRQEKRVRRAQRAAQRKMAELSTERTPLPSIAPDSPGAREGELPKPMLDGPPLAGQGDAMLRRESLAPSDSISTNMASPAASSNVSLHSEPSLVSDNGTVESTDEEKGALADIEDGSVTDVSVASASLYASSLAGVPLTTANVEKLASSPNGDITPSASRAQSVAAASASNTSAGVASASAMSGAASKSVASASTEASKPASAAAPKAPEKARYVLRRAHKRYLISAPDLPPVLVIHLKRFQQTNKSSLFGAPFTSLRKRDDDLTFPQELDLSPFLAPTEKPPQSSANGAGRSRSRRAFSEPVANAAPAVVPEIVPEYAIGGAKYALYAVVVHFGTLVTGHYSAYVRSDRYGKGPGGTSDRRWFFCSDEDVRACSLDEVLKSKAYILFYERLDKSVNPAGVQDKLEEQADEEGLQDSASTTPVKSQL